MKSAAGSGGFLSPRFVPCLLCEAECLTHIFQELSRWIAGDNWFFFFLKEKYCSFACGNHEAKNNIEQESSWWPGLAICGSSVAICLGLRVLQVEWPYLKCLGPPGFVFRFLFSMQWVHRNVLELGSKSLLCFMYSWSTWPEGEFMQHFYDLWQGWSLWFPICAIMLALNTIWILEHFRFGI